MKVDPAHVKAALGKFEARVGVFLGRTVKVLTGGVPLRARGPRGSSLSTAISERKVNQASIVETLNSKEDLKAFTQDVILVFNKLEKLIQKRGLQENVAELEEMNTAIKGLQAALENEDVSRLTQPLEDLNKSLRKLKDSLKSTKTTKSFKDQGAKKGVTAGYVSTKKSKKSKKLETYILKKTLNSVIAGTEEVARKIDDDKNSNRREFLLGDVWGLILPNRSPKVNIVLEKGNFVQQLRSRSSKYLYVTSKFFKDFQPLKFFASNGGLDQVHGIEDIIAACILMGDEDFHMENVGTIPDGKGGFIAVKIDHGKSGLLLFDNPENLREGLVKILKDRGYVGIKNGKPYFEVPIDQEKLRAALEKMSKANTEEMSKAIGRNTQKLLDAGFQLSPKDLLAESLHTFWLNRPVDPPETRAALVAIRDAIESGDLNALDAIKSAHSAADPDVLAFVDTLIAHRDAFNNAKTDEQKIQFVGDFYKEKFDKNIEVIKGFVKFLETQDLLTGKPLENTA